MLPQNYEFQGPTYKKARLEGLRDGRLEGQAVMAASLLDVLEARGLSISDEVRQRVHGSADLEQLRQWIRRAAVITTVDELFA